MMKRSTLVELESDPALVEAVLSRMQGAMPSLDSSVAQLPRPWEVCREMGLSYGGFLAWVNADESGGRLERFRRAMEVRALMLAEDALAIADDTPADEVAKGNLRVNTRFRLAKAYNPRVFGEAQPVAVAPVSISIGLQWNAGPLPPVIEGESGEVIEEVVEGARGEVGKLGKEASGG